MVPVAVLRARRGEYDRVAGCAAGGDKVICQARGIRDRRGGLGEGDGLRGALTQQFSLPAERQSRTGVAGLVGVNDECTHAGNGECAAADVPAPVLPVDSEYNRIIERRQWRPAEWSARKNK